MSLKLEGGYATVELKIKGKQTRGSCLYNQGMFSAITELFGYETADISEQQCVIPVDGIGRLNNRTYRTDKGGRVIETDCKSEDCRVIGHLSDAGTFHINDTLYGAESCIYRLRWKNRMRDFANRSAGKKQALQQAMQHLEENHAKLQRSYELLWKSEARYKDLMENAGDIICFLDSEGIITSVNKKGLELSGYLSEELVGRHFISFVDDAFRKEASIKFRRPLACPAESFELIVRTRSADRLMISANTSPIRDNGETVGFMVIARDITREREIAARLLEAERFAARGMVAAEIAHEINNSLANIETALFIFNNIRIDGQYKKDVLKDVYEEIGRMSGIVKGILEVYRADDAVIQTVNINAEIDKIINITERRLKGKGVSLTSRLYPELPPVPCSPGHIKQILLNLIKNAEESMTSSGPKEIIISTDREKDLIRMKVEDTGAGIPDEKMQKIFTPLFTSKVGGTGLGLSICRQIAQKYGGDINIKSKAGKGTIVVVSFPGRNG